MSSKKENYVTPMKPQTHDDQNEDELNPARQGTLNSPHSGYWPSPHRSVLESGHIRYTWDVSFTVSTALLFGWCLLITNLWPTELHVQITANCNPTIQLFDYDVPGVQASVIKLRTSSCPLVDSRQMATRARPGESLAMTPNLRSLASKKYCVCLSLRL